MLLIFLKYYSYEVTICKRSGLLCSHCKAEILSGQQISQCQECRVSTHVTCSHELKPDCTPLNKLKDDKVLTPVPSNDSVTKSQIESWVTIWE